MKIGRLSRARKKVLALRRAFRRSHPTCGDTEYIEALAMPAGVPDLLLIAIRTALAARCGIPVRYIHPDLPIDELRPLMVPDLRSRCRWPDVDAGDIDPVVFEMEIEDVFKEHGVDLTISDAVTIPYYGYSRLAWFFVHRYAVSTVGEWIRAVATAITAGCSL